MVTLLVLCFPMLAVVLALVSALALVLVLVRLLAKLLAKLLVKLLLSSSWLTPSYNLELTKKRAASRTLHLPMGLRPLQFHLTAESLAWTPDPFLRHLSNHFSQPLFPKPSPLLLPSPLAFHDCWIAHTACSKLGLGIGLACDLLNWRWGQSFW